MFAGNTDKSTIVSHVLSPAINARYIRVQPKTWNEYISMRIELVGYHTGNYIKQMFDYKYLEFSHLMTRIRSGRLC